MENRKLLYQFVASGRYIEKCLVLDMICTLLPPTILRTILDMTGPACFAGVLKTPAPHLNMPIVRGYIGGNVVEVEGIYERPTVLNLNGETCSYTTLRRFGPNSQQSTIVGEDVLLYVPSSESHRRTHWSAVHRHTGLNCGPCSEKEKIMVA